MSCTFLLIDNFPVRSTFLANNASLNVCLNRDAKAHCSAKNLADQIANLGALRSVKCNANASQVSILISQVNRQHKTVTLFFLKSCSICVFEC